MNYYKTIILVCIMLFGTNDISAQYNKISVNKVNNTNFSIVQIDNRESSTIVILKGTSPEKDGWSNINEKAFIRIKGSNKPYHLINSINMPISSEAENIAMLFDYPGQEHLFALEFENNSSLKIQYMA